MKVQCSSSISLVFLVLMVPNAWSSKNITMGAIDGFYWKPYSGTIPNDAIVGTDAPQATYIGRGPVWEGGLLIGQITPGVLSLTVTGPPLRQVHIVEDNIEILCSSGTATVDWVIRDSGESIHADSSYLIQAGYERSGFQPLFVARARVSVKRTKGIKDYDMKIGKVTLMEPSRDVYEEFYYPEGTKEGVSREFEVLTIR